jgi:hypothetical protein
MIRHVLTGYNYNAGSNNPLLRSWLSVTYIFGLYVNSSLKTTRSGTMSTASIRVYVGVLISLWRFLFPNFLFAAQPKEFFLDGLKKSEQRSHVCGAQEGNM